MNTPKDIETPKAQTEPAKAAFSAAPCSPSGRDQFNDLKLEINRLIWQYAPADSTRTGGGGVTAGETAQLFIEEFSPAACRARSEKPTRREPLNAEVSHNRPTEMPRRSPRHPSCSTPLNCPAGRLLCSTVLFGDSGSCEIGTSDGHGERSIGGKSRFTQSATRQWCIRGGSKRQNSLTSDCTKSSIVRCEHSRGWTDAK